MAAGLVLPFTLGMYWLFNSRHAALRIAMIPALGMLLLGFAASGSRGGFTELAAVFLYLIVRSKHRLWLAALMVASVLSALVVNPGIVARFQAAQSDGGAGRADIWHIGIIALRDHWFLGAGVGNFPQAYDREYINVYAHLSGAWSRPAHNVPLTVAVELGVVGFGLFVLAAYRQLTMLRNMPTDAGLRELRLTLEAACIGVLMAGQSLSNLNTKYLWLEFSLMVMMRSYLLTTRAPVAPTSPNRSRPWNSLVAHPLEPQAVSRSATVAS